MSAAYVTAVNFPARHGFFTRLGGVSQGAYASLNCSVSSADDPALVAENRARVARAMGVERLLGLSQVHGIDVVTVRRGDETGAAADAMVTALPGIGLGVISADCAPVLFTDVEHGVVGAAHAGWHGAVAGVLEATVAAMRELGAARIAAAVGPCIGPASYEVGADVRDTAQRDAFFRAGALDRWWFDLPGYCAARLIDAGVVTVSIEGSDTCTDDRFWSHRRRVKAGGGPIGHQISVVVALPQAREGLLF